jgi:citrate lyase subunit beta/citryl-CoA lyase
VGTNDIAKETGVDPGEERRYLMPWLMQVVLVARRRGVCVLDGVWNDFGDTAGFDAEARQSVKMAFDGKTLIHPTQIAPANRIFSPAPEAIEEAKRIVAAFELPEHAGKGVINLAGKMVERLHRDQAARLLALHASIAGRG